MGILTDLGHINFNRQLSAIGKFRAFTKKYALQGVIGGDQFDNVGQDFVLAELFGRRYPMIAVQDVKLVFDLVKLNRSEIAALPNGILDPFQPLRGCTPL